MNGFKSTLLASLLAGAALSAAPALAQDAPPPAGEFPRFDLSRFDTDGDGKVSLDEIAQARKAEAAALDANSDGKLSYDELVAGELREIRPRIEAKVKARIEALDADGDGQLSAAELATPPSAGKMFERFDADHDGVVTRDEIRAARDAMRERMQSGDHPGPRGDGPRADKREDRGAHGDRPGDRRAQPPKPPVDGAQPAQ